MATVTEKTPTTENLSTYLADFERQAQAWGRAPAWVEEARKRGMQRFSELGFPTSKLEDWKYTSLVGVSRTPYELAAAPRAVTAEQIQPMELGLGAPRAVFVDGRFQPELSDFSGAQVKVESLAESLQSSAELVEPHLTRVAGYENHAMAALNTAFLADGAVINIPDGTVVEQPIHVLFLSSAERPNSITHPRVLVLAGRDSEAVIVETYAGLGEEVYWTNAVTELVLGENAHLEHYKVQIERPKTIHTAVIQALQARDSHYVSHSISFGGSLVRNDINSILNDTAAECTLNGLFAVKDRQHVDHHTTIDHTKPHCNSRQVYKGVLDERGTGVFNGKVIVRKDAQKTDALQSNKNLLLSAGATIDTKPQLEIEANDVKCTHGATVGQIDDEAAFYLQSRGLTREAARGMLTYAFAADVLEQVRVAPIRSHFEERLMNWLAAPASSNGAQ